MGKKKTVGTKKEELVQEVIKKTLGDVPKKPQRRKKDSPVVGLDTPGIPEETVTEALVRSAGFAVPRTRPNVVPGGVSTIDHTKDRYDEAELEEFRTLINAKLEEAQKDYERLVQTIQRDHDDPNKGFRDLEEGQETMSREETEALAGRQEKFIKHLGDALLRIKNGRYGICRVTGKLISKERLRLVPHATLSIEAKQQMAS
jgi:RNA polymerase-binding transcription factor DksA